MSRTGRRSRNLNTVIRVRVNPDVAEVIKTAAEYTNCNSSDVIRTCIEATLTASTTAPIILKQLQRGLNNGGSQ